MKKVVSVGEKRILGPFLLGYSARAATRGEKFFLGADIYIYIRGAKDITYEEAKCFYGDAPVVQVENRIEAVRFRR